jgi:DNA-binding transcriptional MerR regulator
MKAKRIPGVQIEATLTTSDVLAFLRKTADPRFSTARWDGWIRQGLVSEQKGDNGRRVFDLEDLVVARTVLHVLTLAGVAVTKELCKDIRAGGMDGMNLILASPSVFKEAAELFWSKNPEKIVDRGLGEGRTFLILPVHTFYNQAREYMADLEKHRTEPLKMGLKA